MTSYHGSVFYDTVKGSDVQIIIHGKINVDFWVMQSRHYFNCCNIKLLTRYTVVNKTNKGRYVTIEVSKIS